MTDRVISGSQRQGDDDVEITLRPQLLSEFVGQPKLNETLGVFIEAARRRREPLDHVLLFGPPGLGKTTLAHIVAKEMGSQIRVTAGPVLEKAGDLAAILTSLSAGDVLFIDEIHRIPASVEEILYPAMEDGKLDLVIGSGPGARTIELKLAPFTLVGATTRAGLLSQPFAARFGITHRLDFYSIDSIRKIILRSAQLLGCPVETDGAEAIARRARGTPRVANRLLRRVRDYAEVAGASAITADGARSALDKLEVDSFGLDDLDRRILLTIIQRFSGGPVGLSALAHSIGEDKGTIEELYEPYLLQTGLITRTPKGRMVTPLTYRHLGLTPKTALDQGQLFG